MSTTSHFSENWKISAFKVGIKLLSLNGKNVSVKQLHLLLHQTEQDSELSNF